MHRILNFNFLNRYFWKKSAFTIMNFLKFIFAVVFQYVNFIKNRKMIILKIITLVPNAHRLPPTTFSMCMLLLCICVCVQVVVGCICLGAWQTATSTPYVFEDRLAKNKKYNRNNKIEIYLSKIKKEKDWNSQKHKI